MQPQKLNREIVNGINVSRDCERICTETVVYCLQMGGKHAAADHIQLLIDCADICHLTGQFLLRSGTHHNRIANACAEVCDTCAESCEQFSDQPMVECAKACRTCAEACRKAAAVKMRP